jgi:CheY-like chemotaxis protein
VLKPESVDASALVHSLADMLRRTIDQRIRIAVETPTSPLVCLADPGQLESALLNIAINARDAMPEGGTLTFRVAPSMLAPSPDAAGEEAPAEHVDIAIADTGTGMSEAVLERAFEPFFTTKEAGRGTGLGLSTVYGFAKQSNGAVRLDSTPGAGTTVTLVLPRAPRGDANQEVDAGAASRLPEGLRVLMVEDDGEVRAVVQAFLYRLNCVVTACADGEQALLELTPDARFDLLLTDVALGAGMRGTDLAHEAVRRMPGLRVLLMSGYASGLIEAPPQWELLRKPYTRAELAAAVARAIRKTVHA